MGRLYCQMKENSRVSYLLIKSRGSSAHYSLHYIEICNIHTLYRDCTIRLLGRLSDTPRRHNISGKDDVSNYHHAFFPHSQHPNTSTTTTK